MVSIKYIFTYRPNSKWIYSNGNMMCSDNIDIVQLFENWGGWGENMKNRISWSIEYRY